ncbi:MAG TPA: IPT/TIG domain-containing protein [Bryobacteraceae bacterium]|nr:IPT/TIG domain-containing protein [Bryobacteraceae bacterium]
MAAPVLASLSPSSLPPGAVVTVTGSGFDAGARIGLGGTLLETTRVSAGQLTAVVPADLVGTAGSTAVLAVLVQNEDAAQSGTLPVTVVFPFAAGECWTTLDAVVAEVPNFKRGGGIQDGTILGWMRSIAQSINGAMLRRGLSLDAADWQQPAAGSASPTPQSVLELINRYGAAARLAAAVGGQFGSGEWGFAKDIRAQFEREFKALESGSYDKLFRPAAATIETGRQFDGGDLENAGGAVERAFSKTKVF